MSRMSDADQIARRQREEAMTTIEHAELLERIAVMREKNQRRGLGITEAEEMLSEIATLASTPSPAQPPEATVTIRQFHHVYPGTEPLHHVYCSECPDFGFCGELAEAEDKAASHRDEHDFAPSPVQGAGDRQQPPQVALNEARAQALDDAADAWHAEHSGTRPGPYNWLRARAAELRTTPQKADVE